VVNVCVPLHVCVLSLAIDIALVFRPLTLILTLRLTLHLLTSLLFAAHAARGGRSGLRTATACQP
jgi:hypothetical protein